MTRVAAVELRGLLFDITAVCGLTAWAADGWRPWWGVLFALLAAALAGGMTLLGGRLMHAMNALLAARRAVRLTVDEGGIRMQRRQPAANIFIAWDDIVEVVAMKADLFTVDCLMLALQTQSAGIVTIDERMSGWTETVEAFSRAIACEPFDQWFFAVAFPAFEPNPRRIFPWSPEAHPPSPAAPPKTERTVSAAAEADPGVMGRVVRYVGAGTGALFVAGGIGLGSWGVAFHDGRLQTTAWTIVAYVAVTRLSLLVYFALRPESV